MKNKIWIIGLSIIFMICIVSVMFLNKSSDDPFPTIPQTAKAGDLIHKKKLTYSYGKNEYDAEYGILIVPENRSKLDSKLIGIPVVKVNAVNESPLAPIFILEGGPGNSNMQLQGPEELLLSHDMVLVGYRGMDGSTNLRSKKLENALRADDLLSEEGLSQIENITKEVIRDYQAQGIDLSGYSPFEVVHDLDAARRALGYDKINLYSVSYGTRLAQYYDKYFSEHIQYAALLGINPPGAFMWEPDVMDSVLEQYETLWKAETSHSKTDKSLIQMMDTAFDDAPDRWLFFNINKDKIRVASFFLLMETETSPYVFDAYQAAANGDYSGFAALTLACDWLLPTASNWGDMLAKGVMDYDKSRNYRKIETDAHTIGSPVSKLLFGGFAQSWPKYPVAEELKHVHPSSTRTLLINGNLDMSTPAVNAENDLIPHLSNATYIKLHHMGHTVTEAQPQAMERLLTSFYRTGIADDSLFMEETFSFHSKFNITTIVKTIVFLLFCIPIMIIIAIYFIMKKIRSKQNFIFDLLAKNLFLL
ncbi:alpha/beta hydrolase [Chengkuizengella sediminis]|uniref:alpha/beta hydrolase n=1 Tax=Chengkuizengella sediminis TaxID=1885917 RepID=UPI001389835A|nr:alpha/beta hydrolase [Chengkuizengella sediminis]NDI34059.1 alpha/beta fold hydrolase [Chengkuizengella sediminis]